LNPARRIAHSSATLLFSNFVNKVIGFLIMITVARILGAEQFGIYTAVFAYVSLFALLTDLGLTTVVTRKLAQDNGAGCRWLGAALMMRWPTSVLMYIMAVASALWLYGWEERTGLIAISSLTFVTVPLTTYSAIFHAQVLPHKPALVSLCSRVALLAAVQWLARSGGSVAGLVLLEVIFGSAANITTWLLSRPLCRPVFSFDRSAFTQMLTEGIPLFLTSAFMMLYFRIDVFFLEYYRNSSAIGVYAAAYRLTEAMPVFATALTASIFPVLCRQVHAANEASLEKLVRISLKILLGAVLPLAVVLAFYNEVVVRILYGNRFDGSAPILAILACSQVRVFTNILMSTLLVARGKGSRLMVLTVIMLFLNIVLNFMVIPRHGVTGAAWTTLATELAGTVGCLAITSTAKLFLQTAARLTLPVLGCAAVLFSFTPAKVDTTLASLWPLLAVCLVYPISISVLRVFDQDEWKRLRTLAWQ
jgi:O-antigen/teichoic acid export membrane protein